MEEILNPSLNANAQGGSEANASNSYAAPAILADGDIQIDAETRKQIDQKVAELKAQNKVKKIYVIVVKGDPESDEKPYYIGYFRRPTLMNFSQYMSLVQKDPVQANFMLAKEVFLGGDRELIDNEEMFLYGTMQQLGSIIESRSSDIIKK